MHKKSSKNTTDTSCNSPSKSKLIDMTPVALYTRIPSKVDCFRGRKREMYEISELLENFRFLLIKGMMGIGKSSLVKEFAVRVLSRFIYQDGVIFLNMRGKTTIESFYSLLVVDIEERGSLKNNSNRFEDKDLNLGLVLKILENKEVLLIIDNIDGLILRQE